MDGAAALGVGGACTGPMPPLGWWQTSQPVARGGLTTLHHLHSQLVCGSADTLRC